MTETGAVIPFGQGARLLCAKKERRSERTRNCLWQNKRTEMPAELQVSNPPEKRVKVRA